MYYRCDYVLILYQLEQDTNEVLKLKQQLREVFLNFVATRKSEASAAGGPSIVGTSVTPDNAAPDATLNTSNVVTAIAPTGSPQGISGDGQKRRGRGTSDDQVPAAHNRKQRKQQANNRHTRKYTVVTAPAAAIEAVQYARRQEKIIKLWCLLGQKSIEDAAYVGLRK